MSWSQFQAESAKAAARRLFQKVNYTGGALQSYELSSLLQQTYDYLKIPYKPTQNDIQNYKKVLDANGDGQVTLEDLEKKAIEWLSSGKPSQTREDTSYSFQKSKKPVKTEEFQQNSYQFNYQPQTSYKGYQQYDAYAQKLQQTKDYSYTSKNEAYNYKNTEYQPYNPTSYLQPSYSSTLNNPIKFATSTVYTNAPQIQIPSSSSTEHFSFEPNSANIMTTSYYQQPPSPSSSSQSNHQQRYNPQAQTYILNARKIFRQHADPVHQAITAERVPDLLEETYASLGRQGYRPNAEDVRVWMKLCDGDGDGYVQLEDYEYFVIRSLQRSGINVYQ